ncbi:phosphotransferase [Streptomyces sp. L2]|uniref:phosphotransferase family protein n=1 Tax=Streptomyces sp. L2 TaxID=2162665 RepID=UPI0010131EAF|nr:phosphotransferase [Streptomyces sp. L2]
MTAVPDTTALRWHRDQVYVVRTLPGADGFRACLKDLGRQPAEYQWMHLRTSAAPAASRAGIDRLARILPPLGVDVRLPSRSFDLSLWGGLPRSGLLFDVLFGNEMPGMPTLTAMSARLGRALARLHQTRAGTGDVPGLPGPAWARPWGDHDAYARHTDVIRAGLSAGLPVERASWTRRSSLVHGRPGAGDIVPGEPCTVLGWEEAGVGNPVADLGCLLGDYAEAVAVAPDERAGLLREAIGALTDAYRAAHPAPADAPGGDEVMGWLVERVAHHLALSAVFRGDEASAYKLAKRVQGVLPSVKGAVDG